jgi:hypothetical protein
MKIYYVIKGKYQVDDVETIEICAKRKTLLGAAYLACQLIFMRCKEIKIVKRNGG